MLHQDRAAIQRRTLVVLLVCQVLGGLGIGVALTVGALVAEDLSGSARWAGAATTMITLGSAAAAVPLARRAARLGRRPALSAGWAVAAMGALAAVASVWIRWFPLLLLGLAMIGSATAANLQSRYAATDLAAPARRGRALSLVLWATTVGSVIGPNLSAPTAQAAESLGWPPMVGPFLVTGAMSAVCASVLLIWLRPDPLLTSRALAPDSGSRSSLGGGRNDERIEGRRQGGAWAIRDSPGARVAVLVLLTGHAVMVAVMAMTPVHMVHHGASLHVVGLTISAHIAGMFAFSPVFGVLADSWGRRPVMILGASTLVLACLISGTAAAGGPALTLGLFLLGLGWSAGMVAGSAALSDSIAPARRPAAQGVSDSWMGLAGAGAAALSGLLIAGIGFGGLTAIAACLTVPALVALSRDSRPRPRPARADH